ncbi:Histidine triad containing protein [Blastocystis sp. ATCC 50177/Nand II]|uniref:Histidine triad containing protein n=1 Tax=Blastocystis sp. subtype 1 (strain ATCC 50177 / NandII) TaxID=478820 RepID=A0A196SLF7_BLAHN|nr:Histidine triad containing protein [Blastocystis sp. ATCC 50177/Nand II]
MKRRCIFCKIPNDPESNRIVVENERLYVIEDIRPCAALHFLVIPKRHIFDCRSLHASDLDLLNEMETIGRKVLREHGASDNVILGFHDRPWTSIHHLHLHCIGLPFKNCWSKSSHSRPFFISLDKLRKRYEYTCFQQMQRHMT